jgi:hypothetical protein
MKREVPMSPEEKLKVEQTNLDNAMFACLTNLNSSDEEFQALCFKTLSCADAYTEALKEASKSATQEIAEHQRRSVKDTLGKVNYFLMVLVRYRQQAKDRT